jgi:arylsulfatase A-like enzyme
MKDRTRRQLVQLTAAGLLAGMLAGCGGTLATRPAAPASSTGAARKKPNVLFIAVDDLRPELGCYGNPEIKTPNIDALAAHAVVFERAYAQAAACAPSRASLMTGMRPDSTRVWSLGEKFRETIPDVVTMPQHFKKSGYHTVSMGKIFHNHMPDRVSFDEPDLKPPEYMTEELIDRDPESFYYDEDLKKELAEVRLKRLERNPDSYADGWAYGRSWEASDAPDDAFYDGAQTTLAIEKLQELAKRGEPFYFALGYFRPHLPFVAPKKYWDLYDREQISPAPNPFLPEGAPPFAMNSQYELRGCYDLEWVKHPGEERLPEETARLLKHGYYASVSYIDASIGRLMQGLEDAGLADDTIVVLWGDHGWKLGEHGSFCKQTNYNVDTQVPLIVRAPRVTAGRSDRLVELVDLYPSLCEMAGIDVPANMEGVSFTPLLEDPAREWKSAVFSQFHQRPKVTPDGGRYMGYSMVTGRYHLVEWHTWDNEAKTAGELVAREVYDNKEDPQENRNLADLPEHVALVKQLSRQLAAGWQGARPPLPEADQRE